MSDDELLHARVYGTDPDDADRGPQPGHEYAALVGGPLDGLLLDVTGWPVGDVDQGVALITERGAFGPGGRAHYEPSPGDRTRLHWSGDMP